MALYPETESIKTSVRSFIQKLKYKSKICSRSPLLPSGGAINKVWLLWSVLLQLFCFAFFFFDKLNLVSKVSHKKQQVINFALRSYLFYAAHNRPVCDHERQAEVILPSAGYYSTVHLYTSSCTAKIKIKMQSILLH